MNTLAEAIPTPVLLAFSVLGFCCVGASIAVLLLFTWPAHVAAEQETRIEDELYELEHLYFDVEAIEPKRVLR